MEMVGVTKAPLDRNDKYMDEMSQNTKSCQFMQLWWSGREENRTAERWFALAYQQSLSGNTSSVRVPIRCMHQRTR